MKTMKNWLLTGLMFLIVSSVFSQGKIIGTITDGQMTLPGTNIAVKGSTTGASSDFDGKFSINTSVASGELVISFIGFDTKTVKFSVSNGATVNLGTIVLNENSNQLNEIIVKSTVIDVAKDRKTPVAVSTIKAAEIQEKLGTQEFPEILKNTPSVYATKSGGGFGDSRINIRGFDQKNIAVLINGVPVNDMENSAVYWSNWAGLSDVTSALQVQRGLGSSKLAISSVGGTINMVTRASDMKEGGAISTGFGNANYLKTQASYSTGKMKNGVSASILLSSTSGDGYVDGTEFRAQNYYFALGYSSPSNRHDFQFTFTGAPQWHNQRSAAPTIAQYIKYGSNGEPDIKYNSDWGTLAGKEYSFRTNFYHKPVASFNYDFKINETTKLSAVVYGSWGRGGGSNGTGAIRGNKFSADNLKELDGTIDIDKIVAYNSGQPVNIAGTTYTRSLVSGEYQNAASTSNNATNGISKIASINSHNWYGGVVNLNKKLNDNLTLDFGLDARAYKGIHYQNVVDLLGGSNFIDKTDINNPTRVLYGQYASKPNGNPFFNSDYQEKINYKNDGLVRWYGAFTQLEYSKDNLTAFVQGAVSQQGFKRNDYFVYLKTDPLYSSEYENILGGNVKGGVNYNINEKHNVFINSGFYSKQPFFTAVYPNNRSVVNPTITNEKIAAVEAGYGFRSSIVNVNVNLYHTTWKDRYIINTISAGGYYALEGVNETHSGAELEVNAKITNKFKANAMFSIGDWKYNGNGTSTQFDNSNVQVGTSTDLFLDNVKVGDAAQLTASIGASYEVFERVTVDANYNYNNKLYAAIDPSKFSNAVNNGSLELPSYGLMDAGFSYKMLVGRDKANSVVFRLNVNNVLDEKYISESRTNIFASDFVSGSSGPTYESAGKTYNGVATANQVYFGFGRTWNFSLRYNF